MQTALPRKVRVSIENRHKRPEQTAREQEREERILAGAQIDYENDPYGPNAPIPNATPPP